MAQIMAIANQKGGVGKTTTSINLAASLVANGQRILLVDLDPQGNATTGSGVDKHSLVHSTNTVILHDCEAWQACLTVASGFDLIPTNGDLTVAEVHLMAKTQRESFLQRALQSLDERYDYILIDCPPALNMLTVNALVAAAGVLIPMQCEYFALEGLAALLDTIAQIKASVNPQLTVAGILRTMYDPRSRLCKEVSQQLLTHFGDSLFETVIPRNIRLAEAPSYGLSALDYAKHATGSAAYRVLATEFIQRQRMATV